MTFFKRISIEVTTGNTSEFGDIAGSNSSIRQYEWTHEMGVLYDGLEIHCAGSQEGVSDLRCSSYS